MASFRYQAVDPKGEVIRGRLEAASEAGLASRLSETGHVLLEARLAASGTLSGLLDKPALGARVGEGDLHLLTQSLATLLGAGVPLEQAVRFCAAGSRSKVLRRAMERVLGHIRDGAAFADAIGHEGDIFKDDYVGVVRAAEHSGDLGAGLGELAAFLERRNALTAGVRSAMIYPAILVVMIVLTLILVVSVVLPEFRPIFEDAGAALPLPTQIVMAVGTFVESYWGLMVLLMAGGAAGAIAALKNPAQRMRFDEAVLALPLAGALVSKIETARFARTLGALLRGGVDLPRALQLTALAVRNKAFEAAIQGVQAKIREGGDLASHAADTGIFPDLAVQLVRIGEEAGRLHQMLTEAAALFERDTKLAVDRLMAALTPALTIGMGLLIAGLIGSVLVGILSINEFAV